MLPQNFYFATNLLFCVIEACKPVFEALNLESPLAHICTFKGNRGTFCHFATEFATDLSLKILSVLAENNKNSYPYRLCEIKDRGGDLSKRWYLEFWVFNVKTNQLERKQEYVSTKLKTRKERLSQLQYDKRIIDKALIENKVLGVSQKPKKIKKNNLLSITKDSSIKAALEYAMKAKHVGNSKRTEQAYTTICNRLIEFFELQGFEKISEVTTTSIFEFMDWLVVKYDLGNTTRNNYLENIKSTFKVLTDRKILKKNPCRKLRKLKESKAKHQAYSDTDSKTIKDYLMEHDPQMYLFCSFIYYGYIRPKELRYLQVKNIGEDKILIPDSIFFGGQKIDVSKNRKSEYVVIPSGLKKLIEEFDLLSYPPDYFIFTTKLKPGEKHASYNYFNARYRKILKELNMPMDYTSYSWKHTGVIKLYNKIKDIRKVQQQCRHTKIETTVDYMRDLGLFDNKEVELMFPEF